MSFTPVNDGDLAVAPQLQQILDALQGVAGAGQPIDLVALDSATEVALTVRNLGTGGAMQVLSTTGTELLFVDDSGVAFGGTLTFTDITAANATLSGNLTLSGSGKRITGDFTNATRSNRVLFQTTTANSPTNVGAIPSGTGTTGTLSAFNNAAPDSASVAVQLSASSAAGQLRVESPSLSYQPLEVYTNGTKQATLSTAGALTLHNGGLTVTTGGITLTAGNLAVSSGTLTASGTITSSGGSLATTNGSINSAGAISGSSLSVTGQAAGATVVSTSGAITSANGITATTGNVTASAGSVATANGSINTAGAISGTSLSVTGQVAGATVVSTSGAITAANGLTVTAGSATVAAGGLNVGTSGAASGAIKTSGAVTVGNTLTVSAGNLGVSSGTITASGTITSSAGSIATAGGSINSAGAVSGSSVNSTGQITGTPVVSTTGLYPNNQATYGYTVPSAAVQLLAGDANAINLGPGWQYVLVANMTSGTMCMATCNGPGNTVTKGFDGGSGFEYNSHVGAVVAIYHDGTNYRISNRTAGAIFVIVQKLGQ